MKLINHENHLLKPIIILLIFTVSLFSGCALINEYSVKTRPIVKSPHHYDLVFQKRDYSEYKLDFFSQKDQLILSTVDEVYIIDLKTEALVKHLKTPELSLVTSTYLSINGANFFQFTTDDMQIWNTTNWTHSKQLKTGKHPNRLNGFSKNEELLYFAGTLWSGTTFEKIYEFGGAPVPNDYDFSQDNRYFLSASHGSGISIIDIENRRYSATRYRKKGVSQVSFRDNNSFYASYGARIDLTRSGYFPKKLGLFAVEDKDQIESFSPSEKITCWINDPKFGLLVSLYNGDIYLLNHQLGIQHKWHMNDFVRSCGQGRSGEVWLGSEKTGLYKADLDRGVISHEYETSNSIFKLKISSDNRYLGIEELLPGERQVKVLYLN
jgi:hypothetical protein